jgi:hypothetical protein
VFTDQCPGRKHIGKIQHLTTKPGPEVSHSRGERPVRLKMAKFIVVAGLLSFFVLASADLWAQAANAALSGTITDRSGAVVPNAKITAKSVPGGQATETQADASGRYQFSNLTPGEYQVSASAEGFSLETSSVTLAAGASQTVDLRLAPSLSLQGLGFPPSQTQGNPQEQATLDKRTHMLKMHQRLGLITAVPMVATVFTGGIAGGKQTSSSGRDAHAALGGVTAGLYFTTAYYSIFAPKVPGTPTRGPIRLHKAMAWIHGPGMVLTPILGILAFQQKSDGEKIHGIASAHVPVASVTAIAYGIAIVSVSLKKF